MPNHNITYFLGAGASANTLPIVKKMNWALNQIYINFQKLSPQTDAHRWFINEIKWLQTELYGHPTVDTLAKRFWLQNESSKLNRLKVILSTFFTVLQCSKPLEPRYDGLLAGLLGKRENGIMKLNETIRFITWNYDFQIEQSVKRYILNKEEYSAIQNLLRIYPNITKDSVLHSDYALVHLNGIAGFYDLESNECGNLFRYFDDAYKVMDSIYSIIDNHEIKGLNFHDRFSFAWEETRHGTSAINHAIEIMKKTQILIIIGYSFPFFNRDIDRRLFRELKQCKKIYFQAPNPNINLIKQQFNLGMPIEAVNDTESFFIPHEL